MKLWESRKEKFCWAMQQSSHKLVVDITDLDVLSYSMQAVAQGYLGLCGLATGKSRKRGCTNIDPAWVGPFVWPCMGLVGLRLRCGMFRFIRMMHVFHLFRENSWDRRKPVFALEESRKTIISTVDIWWCLHRMSVFLILYRIEVRSHWETWSVSVFVLTQQSFQINRHFIMVSALKGKTTSICR